MAIDLEAHLAWQEQELLKAGWTQQQVDSVFRAVVDGRTPSPLPTSARPLPPVTAGPHYIPTETSEELPKSDDAGAPAETEREPDQAKALAVSGAGASRVSSRSLLDSLVGNTPSAKPEPKTKPPSKTNAKSSKAPKFYFVRNDEAYYSKVTQYSSLDAAREQLGRDVPVKQIDDKDKFMTYLAGIPTADDPLDVITAKTHSYYTGKDYAQWYLYGDIVEGGKTIGWILREGDTDKYHIYYTESHPTVRTSSTVL